MTHNSPHDYTADDLQELPASRPPPITGRSIIAAVGEVLAEERKARIALQAEVAELRAQIERLEAERGVKSTPRLVATPNSSSMIA